ncbi:MAG TPA: OmpA family protein [Nitrospiraceae bacterium]|nr:OmpA family protein [Nitrospiraceae bacterium]
MLHRHQRLMPLIVAGIVGWSSGSFSAGAPLFDISYGEGALQFSAGFIQPTLDTQGVVAKTPYNKTLLGKGDIVYLRMNQLDHVAADQLYSVYRRAQKVFHPANRRYLGDLTNVVGIVRIIKLSHEFAVAKIERSYGPIMVGNGIMPFSPPDEEPGAPGRVFPDVPGMIVEMQPQRTLIAQNHQVYLDWGRDEGLALGDVLEVFRVRTGLPDQAVGEVKVVALQDSTSTGLVVRSTAPFAVGDRFLFKHGSHETVHAHMDSPDDSRFPSQTKAHRTLTKSLVAEIAKGDVSVTQEGDKIKINLGDLVEQLEYEPGQAPVKPSGFKILKQISEILKTLPDQHIQVEGHTDSMPIGPHLLSRYPSNQELSEARANLVVRYFMERGLDPSNLSAKGYADRRPVSSNASEEGRRKNRRIELELSAKTSAQPVLSTVASPPVIEMPPSEMKPRDPSNDARTSETPLRDAPQRDALQDTGIPRDAP